MRAGDVRVTNKRLYPPVHGSGGSPILVADRILFLDETGRATWVRAGRTFEALGQNELPGRTLATPAFAGGAMYLRTDEALYKIASP